MQGDKTKEFPQILTIGCHSMSGPTPDGLHVVQPILQRIARRGGDHDNQRRMARSKTPAKKESRSVPCWGLN